MSFFNYCVAEDYIIKNPCFKLTIPGKIEEKRQKEIEPFSEDEIGRFKQTLKGNGIEMLILLCLGTGLREGELLGLSFEDINFQKEELYVKKHLKCVKIIYREGNHEYKQVLQIPKTKNSLRTVPIPTLLIPRLNKHIASQKEKFLKNGIPFSLDALVFTTDSCKGIDSKNLLRAWQRVLEKAGVRYRNFHTLRHTYATKLFENGIPLKTVSMLLGHADIKITADTYTHVIPKEKVKAADTLNSLFM